MRKDRLHVFTIILGSILACAIIFSQFHVPCCDQQSEKATAGQEQAENKGGDTTESYISLPTFSLPVPVHVQANLDAYCLFEIFFEKDNDVDHVEEKSFYADRFFQTMFRVIIAPNAP